MNPTRILTSAIFIGLIWTGLSLGMLFWNLQSSKNQIMELAYAEARANLNKDFSFRRWASEHGGVYVPITEKQQPIPWLDHLPNRDVITTTGQKLTLLNPASMLQQIMTRYTEEYGIKGRITGLRYLNPQNAPDAWEKTQLESFVRGEKNEVWAESDINGQPHLRYLRAMFMQADCVKCHKVLGYKEGDMRGATGVNLPLTPYLARLKDSQFRLSVSHLSIWLLGLLGITLVTRKLQHHEQRILSINEALEERVALRTQALQDSMQHLRIKEAAIASAANPMAICNLNHKITYVNQAFIRFWQLAHAEQAIGRNISDFIGETATHIMHSVQKKDAWRELIQIEIPNQNTLDILLSTSLVKDESGQALCLLYSIEDLSQQKQTEQALISAKLAAESASRTKSEFLANMSHEIRTPMNAVLGLTQLVLESDLPAHQHELLKKAHTSAQSLLGILNDILDYSKIEAGQMNVEHITFNLEDPFKRIVDLFSASIEEKGLELIFDFATNLPKQIKGDPLHLTQVLTNLMSNAVKFTEFGFIKIKTEIVSQRQDDITLSFAIRDSGIGINMEQMQHLFQSFSQADESTTRKYGGTGLGLSISQRLVQLMGGEIYASGEIGQGSTFTFTIRTQAVTETVLEEYSLQGLRTLIIDEHEETRLLLQQYLRHWGEESESAASGEDGLTLIKFAQQAGNSFDLILINWQLPGLSGIATLKQIELLVSQNIIQRPRYIMMAAFHDNKQLLQETRALHLHGIICKPILPSEFYQTLINCHFPQHVSPLLTRQNSNQLLQLQGMRVLLVEDNKVNRLMACELLERRGVSVQTACNGLEAIDSIEKWEFDAVLMDLHMPVMDGLEATRRIRERQPNLPIIAMTAAVSEEDIIRCRNVGMVDFIAKPITPDSVTNTLVKWSKHTQSKKTDTNLSEFAEAFLPDSMPEFDLNIAVKRLDGNRNLLAKLLLSFVKNNQQTQHQLDTFLAQHQYRDAYAMLHALKRVAANLGAHQLYESCRHCEKELKLEHLNITTHSEFNLALTNAMKAIQDHVVTFSNKQIEQQVDIVILKQVLQCLIPYLKQHELIPDELLKTLFQLVHFDSNANLLAQLIRQIDDFEYDSALHTIQQLELAYQLTLDNTPEQKC